MLATLPTYIARNKRRKTPLAIIEVQQFATIDIAVHTAELEKTELVILCKGSMYLVFAALTRAASSSQPVIVVAECTSLEEVHLALSVGVGGICVTSSVFSKDERIAGLIELSAMAAARGVSCLVEWQVTDPIPSDLDATGIAAIILTELGSVNSTFLRELCLHLGRKGRLATFLEADELTPRVLGNSLRTGLSGYVVRGSVESAFTAGLRTGLRNRSALYPVQYERFARIAAAEAVHNILKIHKQLR